MLGLAIVDQVDLAQDLEGRDQEAVDETEVEVEIENGTGRDLIYLALFAIVFM